MASSFERKYFKNYTFKCAYESNNYGQRVRKGYDVLLEGYLFNRYQLNEPKFSAHSLNWRCAHKKLLFLFNQKHLMIRRMIFRKQN